MISLWKNLIAACFVAAALLVSLPAGAQPPPAREELEKQQQEVLKQVQELEAAAAPDPRLEPLRTLEHLLSRELSLLQESEDLAREKKEAESAPARPATPPEFLKLEELRDEFQSGSEKVTAAGRAIALAQKNVEVAQKEKEDAERLARSASEKAELAADQATQAGLEARKQELALRARVAAETVTVRRAELAAENLRKEILERKQAKLGGQLGMLEPSVSFSSRELDEKLDEYAKRNTEVQQKIETLRLDVATAENLLAAAKTKLESEEEPSPAAESEVHARQLAKQLREQELNMVRDELARLDFERSVWNQRYRFINGQLASRDVSQWRKDLLAKNDELARALFQQRAKREELQKEFLERDSRLKDGANRRWDKDERTSIGRALAAYAHGSEDITGSQRLLQRTLSEIERRTSGFSLTGTLGFLWDGISAAWEYEITAVDDRPITVKKVVIAGILFFLGLFLSYRLSALLARKLLPRFHLPLGAAAAIESLAFYVLVVTVAFLALRIVHIPLTVFTLLGGALAIGVGFGSQNVLNNFISSLILLIEQPVRTGDLVEVDGLSGTIVHIGMRSTKIRTGQNTDIIVPNSTFLQKNVVNWTLNDSRVRTKVSVGVAYGTSLDAAKRVLLDAADSHPEILRVPTPFVWLTGFGDNSLKLELHFWVDLRSFTDRSTIESDVRSSILESFTREGIKNAVPVASL